MTDVKRNPWLDPKPGDVLHSAETAPAVVEAVSEHGVLLWEPNFEMSFSICLKNWRRGVNSSMGYWVLPVEEAK